MIVHATIRSFALSQDAGTKAEVTEAPVSSTEELIAAINDPEVRHIVLTSDLADLPGVRLAPGQTLRSAPDKSATLSFRKNIDGLQLTSDNSVAGVALHVTPSYRAIWNDSFVDDLGTFELQSVQTIGRVQILAKDRIRNGHVIVNGLEILLADSRGEEERPHDFGVSVVQGAFTLWNLQNDENVVISADLTHLSVGKHRSPVLGGGIFVSGAPGRGGRLNVGRLQTDGVYVNGGIVPGTPDQIAGGVFVVHGAYVDEVTNSGPVATYGPNDMALDNWGQVDKWLARAKVTTSGPSAIGFVNFGIVHDLRVQAPIETFGQGARGFNVYAGTVDRAVFDRIVTHGDGAVGVQISQPVGTIIVGRGIETFGGTGPSLVKGVIQNLSAIPLSIKQGGSAVLIRIEGGLQARRGGIVPLELDGTIERLRIDRNFGAEAASSAFRA